MHMSARIIVPQAGLPLADLTKAMRKVKAPADEARLQVVSVTEPSVKGDGTVSDDVTETSPALLIEWDLDEE